jgi:hypothetical protein
MDIADPVSTSEEEKGEEHKVENPEEHGVENQPLTQGNRYQPERLTFLEKDFLRLELVDLAF